MKIFDAYMSKKVNKLKFYAVLVIIIAAAAAAFSVYSYFTKVDKNQDGYATITEAIIIEFKLNTITYCYTDCIFIEEEEVWKLFGLIDIDPGIRYLGVQYDGIIRLGINLGLDAKGVKIDDKSFNEEGKTILKIKLPEVIEMSHEQFRNEEVTLFQFGRFTKKEVSRVLLNEAYGERKEFYSKKARELGLYEDAKESAQSQLENFLYLIPAIKNNCIIVWD